MVDIGSGVLGLNSRGVFIMDHNTSDHRNFADSKIATKRFFASHKVPVPQLFGFFSSMEKMPKLEELPVPFVIKPNKGFGGGGIVIIDDRDDLGIYHNQAGKAFTQEDLKRHCQDILTGYYSVSGGRDQVIIEQKIVLDPHIALLGEYGLPDIRVIVYNQIPLVAMLRIPSKYSDGKANLHMGAYAAGIDLGTGEINHLFARNRHVESLEGLGDIRGVVIPDWVDVLELASQAQLLTRMPYIGCDIVLDKEYGPMLLEINARPGLQVQVVNKVRLGDRLKKVADIHVDTYEKGVRLARDMFTRKSSDAFSDRVSKDIIGLREYVQVGQDINNMQLCLAHIDPIRTRGSISSTFFNQITANLNEEERANKITYKEETPCTKLAVKIMDEEVHGLFEINEKQEVPIILGYTITRRFLINPEKYGEGLLPPHPDENKATNAGIVLNQKKQTQETDKKLIALDRKLPILKFLRPVGLEEAQTQFVTKKGKHTFTLSYEPALPDLDALQKELEAVTVPDVPLADIYRRKKQEIQTKIDLLKSFRNEQDGKVSRYSELLYGSLQDNLISEAKDALGHQEEVVEKYQDLLGIEEVEDVLRKFFRIYDIDIKIEFVSDSISRVAVTKTGIRIRDDIAVTKSDLRAIIAHEIETHFFRRFNGEFHDLEILEKGTAGYVTTEEGLAIHHQSRYLSETSTKQTSLYKLYYLLDYIQNHSYREVVELMEDMYEGDYEKVFQTLVRLKRGLHEVDSDYVFFKDSVYLNGYDQIRSYVADGGDIRRLYFGKIHKDDVDLFESQGYGWKENMKLPLFIS